jgi:hypothetical protein
VFRRPRPKPFARLSSRLSLSADDPVHDLDRLQHMLVDINDVIEMLWLEVEDLRGQLARLRGGGEVPAMYARPPTQPTQSAPAAIDVSVLARHVDDASIAADALWFESQWMRGQVASIVDD